MSSEPQGISPNWSDTPMTEWLKDMGLELKPSKTRITHTLVPYEGTVGFGFWGSPFGNIQLERTTQGQTHKASHLASRPSSNQAKKPPNDT